MACLNKVPRETETLSASFGSASTINLTRVVDLLVIRYTRFFDLAKKTKYDRN